MMYVSVYKTMGYLVLISKPENGSAQSLGIGTTHYDIKYQYQKGNIGMAKSFLGTKAVSYLLANF